MKRSGKEFSILCEERQVRSRISVVADSYAKIPLVNLAPFLSKSGMKNFKRLLPILFLSVLPVACQATALPAEMPADIGINYSEDGGMLNRGQLLDVSATKCRVEEHEDQTRNEWNCLPSSALLQTLYKTLRDNQFDLIRIDESGIAYDKPGESISLSYGKQAFNLGTSGRRLLPKWQEKWDTIVEVFRAQIESVKKQKAGTPVPQH
jgi:hypothetical protein